MKKLAAGTTYTSAKPHKLASQKFAIRSRHTSTVLRPGVARGLSIRKGQGTLDPNGNLAIVHKAFYEWVRRIALINSFLIYLPRKEAIKSTE